MSRIELMCEEDFHREVKPEPEHIICHNPKCQCGFYGHPDEYLCPVCDSSLHEVEKANIQYAMEHGVEINVLAHIMNGGV